jgi:hypothetical protein
MSKLLSIGMSTYDDFEGVFFTIQSLRMYHEICNTDQVQFVVVDNNPSSKEGQETKRFVEGIKQKYVPYTENVSSFNKYLIPNYSDGKYILIMDSHVLIENNGINNLLEYYKNNPDCKNLVQGPLWYNDLKNISTHFDPVFRGHMYGIWATNKEAYDKGEPFEIPMQGMGLLSFEKSAWGKINDKFVGFGAEEGYISEKFRQWGGKNICLPNLKWMHRFGRPRGVPFRLTLEDRVYNYFVGWLEIYNDPEHQMIKDIYNHFKGELPPNRIDKIFEKAKADQLK